MIRQQKTIAREVTLSGRGLHTGEDVTMTLRPAEPDTGIRFVRVDLDPPVEIVADVTSIPADAEAVRNTTLYADDVCIHTVEHVLATLRALQVDNVVVALDGSEPPEPPAGGYGDYVTLLREAGEVNQGHPVEVYRIDRPVTYTDGDVEIVAVPGDGLRLSFTIDYANPAIGTQHRAVVLTPEVYEKEIAPARTFVLREDVDRLRELGMIRGGSLETALVYDGDTVMSAEAPRFPDECVRHKLLDLIGDLALLGVPVEGHIHAVKSGHRSHIAFVRRLREAWLKARRNAAATKAGTWDIHLIQQIMPHRYPFLLVDRIVHLEDRKRVVGIKNVTVNEPFFPGHFPGHPIMPAVLIVEAMAQTGGVLLLNTVDDPSRYLVYFTRIDKAKFRRPVLPGDQLRFELELVSLRRGICTMKGQAFVEDALAAEAELSSVIVPR